MKIRKALRKISRILFSYPEENQEEIDEKIDEITRPAREAQAREWAKTQSLQPVRLAEIEELKAKYGLQEPIPKRIPSGFDGYLDTLRVEDKEWVRIARLVRPDVVLAHTVKNNDYTLYSFRITPHLRLEAFEDDLVGGEA